MTPAPPTATRPSWPVCLALLAVTVAVLGGWWRAGRPVPLADAPSARIACVSYAPYHRAGQSPLEPGTWIAPAQIDADLKALSQRFDCVRTYSQGQGLDAVPAIAGRYGMTVLMGVWIGSDAAANERELALAAATARAHREVLRGVIVGNEVLLRGEQTPAALAGYLRRARALLPPGVPLTYADVWEFWLRHPELAGSVDYVTVHMLPYWEDQPVPAHDAVAHVARVYRRVQAAFPGTPVMIGETGWPSAGRPRQGARASRVDEARYLREFLRFAARAHLPYNVIEAFDQPWKRAQEGTVGGYWGIFDAQARPKFPMQGPVVEVPRWWLGWLAALAGALGFSPGARLRPARTMLMRLLAGAATGGALAWQVRQMLYACGPAWEWLVSGLACLLGLATAWRLARAIANGAPAARLSRTERFGWLFGLAYYGLLMALDGRYRDFPLGLVALPCIGYALAAWAGVRPDRPRRREDALLALVLPLLAVLVVIDDRGASAVSWLWLALHGLFALAVLGPRGTALQQHGTDQ